MRKLIIRAFAAAAMVASIAAVVASSASAAPGVTTHTVTLNAAIEGVVDLPALNSQFTKMTIKVNDGTTNWASPEWASTSYQDGVLHPTVDATSGLPDGPLLLEGAQLGAVIYRVDGGN